MTLEEKLQFFAQPGMAAALTELIDGSAREERPDPKPFLLDRGLAVPDDLELTVHEAGAGFEEVDCIGDWCVCLKHVGKWSACA